MATGPEVAAARERMEKSVQTLRQELGSVRAGRASPALLERIRVEQYGTAMPIHQVANVTADGRTLIVQVWDKGAVGTVEKALLKSDLGMNPQTDGSTIRLTVPQLTAERRGDLVRQVRKLAEDQRVAIRNVRRDARDQVERATKAGQRSSDEAKRDQEELQRATDGAMAEISRLVEAKEREITEV